jgi:hypothetical protein
MAIDKSLLDYILAMKKELITIISNLPENPKIKVINPDSNSGLRCFVIQKSDLDNNWTPQYHSFKIQYEKIIEQIDKTFIEQLPGLFAKIIKDKKIKETGGYFYFHDDVVENISSIVKNSSFLSQEL